MSVYFSFQAYIIIIAYIITNLYSNFLEWWPLFRIKILPVDIIKEKKVEDQVSSKSVEP